MLTCGSSIFQYIEPVHSFANPAEVREWFHPQVLVGLANVMTWLLCSVDMQFEEVCCARNARIIIADRLLAFPGELVLWQIYCLCHIAPEVVLNGFLIL